MGFQSTVNQTQAFGVVGEVFNDGPLRASPATIVSSDATNNVIGRAFTLTTGAVAAPQPTDAAIVQAGGTGTFAGILCSPKSYASFGTPSDTLGASLALPNQTIGEMVTLGEIIVSIPRVSSVGDLITYNTTTGELNSVAPTVTFTGSIATSTGVDTLTVTAMSGDGVLQVGQTISGAGILPNTVINSLGTGVGGTGTYILSPFAQTVSSEAMTANALPQEAVSFTASIASTGVMTVTAITAGRIRVGTPLTGTGIPAGSVVTALGSGTGGTGTYTTNVLLTIGSEVITAPAYAFVPDARISRYPVPASGLAVIELTAKQNV